MRIAVIGGLALAGGALVGCSFTGTGRGDDPTVDASPTVDGAARADSAAPGTLLRKPITVDGSVTSESLSDFPIFIHLDADADLAAAADADGGDIFFVAADSETPLDFEIESWDASTGTLLAWVRVDAIDDLAGVSFFIRYGDRDSAQSANPPGVWKNAFLAVFHMNNDPDTPIIDSTGARDGTAAGSMNIDDLVSAKLGEGLELDGGNDVIDFDNPFSGNSPHTISGWVSQEPSGDNEAFVVLGTGGTTDGSRFIHTRFFNGTILTGFYGDDFETDDDIQNDGFKLIHWTYNDAFESRVFLDGALADGPHTHNAAANTQGTEGRIGNAPGGGSGFGSNMGLNGIVDEVRVASTVRSAAWIAAEFANQNAPSGFYTVGPQETF